MVTYFNKTDLTSFGEYLLSEKRRENIRGDLSKVHHADFENWLEERKKPAVKAVAPKTEVPQWLVDHMATAPKELQEYVFKVFPERPTHSAVNDLKASFLWRETPEDCDFWSHVNFQNWGVALHELREKGLLLKATAPKAEVPQWLVDHMATAPKELQDYVIKVFPERCTDREANGVRGSLTWQGTPEDFDFWHFVNRGSWELALQELREKGLL